MKDKIKNLRIGDSYEIRKDSGCTPKKKVTLQAVYKHHLLFSYRTSLGASYCISISYQSLISGDSIVVNLKNQQPLIVSQYRNNITGGDFDASLH